MISMPPKVTVVVGMHWGDEGKGKIIDHLAEGYDVIARCQGGQNAGHTIYRNGRPVALHIVPSGIFYPGKINVVGNGTIVNLGLLCEEIHQLEHLGADLSGLYISDRAHVTFPYHVEKEKSRASAKGIDTTGKGIGDTYAAKMNRIGIRFSDFGKSAAELESLINKALKELGVDGDAHQIAEEQLRLFGRVEKRVTNTSHLINSLIAKEKNVLIEGAQGTLLDIDHGTYPYVTSSNTTAGGAATGLGIAPHRITDVIGVMKAYVTRVGAGPFPTELGTYEGSKSKRRIINTDREFEDLASSVRSGTATDEEVGRFIRTVGGEYGATTGRPRRTGWHDQVATTYSIMINGIGSVFITKLDVLDEMPQLKSCTCYRNGNERIDRFPTSLEVLGACTPEFQLINGWQTSTQNARSFDDLSLEAKNYVKYLGGTMKSQNSDLKVAGVSVGPERDQLILL